jgi:hypothetical protein
MLSNKTKNESALQTDCNFLFVRLIFKADFPPLIYLWQINVICHLNTLSTLKYFKPYRLVIRIKVQGIILPGYLDNL